MTKVIPETRWALTKVTSTQTLRAAQSVPGGELWVGVMGGCGS